MKEGELTLDELGPYTKNPLIVKVLNELHFVEDLGSGRRNLKRYAPLYYPDYKIGISNGNHFEFSITYDTTSRGVTGNQAGNQTGVPNDKVMRLLRTIGESTLTAKEIMGQLNLRSSRVFFKCNSRQF